MLKCENCNNEHDGSFASGRFCSKKCSRAFSTKAKRKEINKKVSKTLSKGNIYNKICPYCKKEFITTIKRRIYCSRFCATKFTNNKPEVKEKIKKTKLKSLNEGKFVGWPSRKNKNPSYPEQYFINLFNAENILDWKREYKIGKWFADFIWIYKKLILEIDGSQHKLKDRIESDRLKDLYIKSKGFLIFRIEWFNPVNEKSKKKLYNQIESFKKLYNSL